VALKGDVSREEDVIAMFDAATEALGTLDGVVVNAAVAAVAAPLVDMSVERMRHVFEVNVLGAYICAREAARRMNRSRGGNGGSIVLISSVASRIGGPDIYVDYAGSKGAVDTLTLGLSKELGREGVRVNAIRPGLIDTELHAAYGAADRPQKMGAMTPMGRPGTADEIGEAIVWLLSDASSYMSGAILDVAGGR
jgi:NAD(P)-dependent dehydrogenase (short-subunit alcohol dehydrogenase family)